MKFGYVFAKRLHSTLGKIDKSILAKKKLRYQSFLLNNICLTNLLITFWNYSYVKSMFSVPSEWLVLQRFSSHQEIFQILSESHFWL